MSAKIIALYGGAFDPFHNGHLATVALLLNSGLAHEVVVVPSGDRPDKSSRASGAQRLAMVRLGIQDSFAGDARVSVSDLHVSGQVGYGTIDVVDHYKQVHARDVVVVVGQELIEDLSQWKESGRLKSAARFLVTPRPGYPHPVMPEGWDIEVLTPSYEDAVLVSSSSLRSLLREGMSCAGLMPSPVVRYCLENGLYR
jgi:nicotinate-nucleotide adenylyltransferase